MPRRNPTPMKRPTGPQSHLEAIGQRFDSFQRNGAGWKAVCPLHADNTPSLMINEGDNGGVVLRCMAGCPTHALLEVVGLRTADLAPDAKVMVNAYDYCDAEGNLLYQSLRYYPKDFRCRRPDGAGGWIWKGVFDGIERVPYRLPQLVNAGAKRFIFVVEGEKDADRLASIGCVATTNVGGAEKWRDDYGQYFTGRHVVIVPDNDSAGRAHAHIVANELHGVAKSVRILELLGLPPKGDVSDWLDAGGDKPKLLALAKAATKYRPTAPINPTPNRLRRAGLPVGYDPTGVQKPLKNKGKNDAQPVGFNVMGSPDNLLGVGAMGRAAVPSYPLEALPRILQRFVESVAKALPCPIDYPGTMLLPVFGALIGRKRCIEIKTTWREFPLLWCASIGWSATRKTPAHEITTAPLRNIQSELLGVYLREKQAWEAAGSEGPKPRLKQIVTTDTTIEALKDILAGNPNGIIYSADELSGWARSMSQYKSGRGDDRQLWLSIWSGTQVVCNRRSQPEPIIIPNPFVAITGGIQPDALGDLIDTSREDGFSARILFSYPDAIPHAEWNEFTFQRSLDYNSICDQLWRMTPSSEPLKPDSDAKAAWVDWVNAHRQEVPPDNLRATWSKSEGHCLRIALILHLVRKLCNETRSADVDKDSMANAVRLIEYFKGHAHRVYRTAARASDTGRIAKTLRWLRKQGGTASARLAHVNGFCRDSTEAKQLFAQLQELGYGNISEGKQGNITFTLSRD